MYRGKQIADILAGYTYPAPLHLHLQAFFKANKKMGSRDRREIRDLSYMYMRLAPLLQGTLDENVKVLQELRQDWPEPALPSKNWTIEKLEKLTLNAAHEKWDKVKNLLPEAAPEALFPFQEFVSGDFSENNDFSISLLQQPWVWLHCLPTSVKEIKARLVKQETPFAVLEDSIFCLPPQTDLAALDGLVYRIQDYSTAKAIEALDLGKEGLWWDCCAGAGGKTLAMLQKEPQLQVMATDVRPQIMNQMEKRLSPKYRSQVNMRVLDLTDPLTDLPKFDGIVADMPCTGSGTWARTPEHLHYFRPEDIKVKASLQASIGDNIWTKLRPGGQFLYITCSIFARENEGFVEAFLQRHPDARMQSTNYLHGYRFGAENIFAAHFVKE